MTLFRQRAVGLDIADRTIEAVELADEGGKKKIASMGRVILSPGIVEGGRILDERRLAEAVELAFKKARPAPIRARQVVFGLPEAQVYTHIFELGARDKNSRDNLILKEAKASIPLKENELLFSYSILSENEEKADIFLAAVSKEAFNEWERFFRKLHLEVKYFDIETLAVFRGLFVKKPESEVCIVDIGASSTSISIFDRIGLRYSYSLNVAGDAMTGDIARELDITLEKAESLKRERGLKEKDDRVFFSLIKSFTPITDNIKSSLLYFKQKTGREVGSIVLVGGSSKMRGLPDYLKEQFPQPVQLGESAFLRDGTSLEYIEAVGLALRAFDREEDRKDPVMRARTSPAGVSILKHRRAGAGDGRTDEIALMTPMGTEKTRKLRVERLVLAAILVAGLASVFGADSYRDGELAAQKAEIQSKTILPASPGQRMRADNIERVAPKVLVTILDTETGWLNVRGGPGTNFPVLERIYPGERYTFLSESEEWYRIQLREGEDGWIHSRYTLKND